MKRCYIGANWLKGVAYGEKSYKSLKSFKFRKLMKYHVTSGYMTSPNPSCRRGTSYSTGSFEAYKVIVPLLQEGLGEVTLPVLRYSANWLKGVAYGEKSYKSLKSIVHICKI